MKHAKVINGIVVQAQPYQEHTPDGFVDVPDEAVPGMHWDGQNLSSPQYQPCEDDVILARERRLTSGFSFTFPDARGIHRIGTTESDMAGWREVTDIANARIATNDATPIAIATDTGMAEVTPLEWMDIIKAAAAFRQPIWAASFALQAMNPIPSDYADGQKYWGDPAPVL